MKKLVLWKGTENNVYLLLLLLVFCEYIEEKKKGASEKEKKDETVRQKVNSIIYRSLSNHQVTS